MAKEDEGNENKRKTKLDPRQTRKRINASREEQTKQNENQKKANKSKGGKGR